jgi:hypothetical protein
LSKIKSLYTFKEGKVRLNLHPGQAKAWRSDARYVFILAGTQGGKTSFGPWWLHREITNKGSGDYLAVTANYDLFKLKMLPEIKAIFCDILKIGRYWRGEKVIEIANLHTGEFLAKNADDEMWARIILRSAASKGGLESSTAKAAWLDEVGQDEFKLDAWQAIGRRVSLNIGRILGTTTLYNFGWMKQLIYDQWKKGDKEIDVIQFDSTLNPLFSKNEFKRASRKLPEWKFNLFYRGEYSRPAGMIFNDYSDSYVRWGGHKIKPFKIPVNWPVVIGIDPGATNTAKIWVAINPSSKKAYVFREELSGDKTTKQHTKEVIDKAVKNKESLIGWYIGAISEKQQRLDYEDNGATPVFEPPVSDVEAGIDRIIALLKEFRIFFFDNCTGLLEQLQSYSRTVDTFGNVMPAIKDKTKYHFVDALRYAVVGVEQPTGVFFA